MKLLRLYIREPDGNFSILIVEPECQNYDTGNFILTKTGKIPKKLVNRVEEFKEGDEDAPTLPW